MRFETVIKLSIVLLPVMAVLPAPAQTDRDDGPTLRVLSFNILQGGGDASNVGFPNRDFGGSRYDELAAVIRLSQADVVGVQEDDDSDRLLKALGEGWERDGSIYSQYDLTPVYKGRWMTVCRVQLAAGNPIFVANCHWRPSDYGPFHVQDHLRKHGAPNDLTKFEQQVLESSDKTRGDRGYQQTLEAIKPALAAEETVVLTGDFNEPSHLDWTPRAAKDGMHRWVNNTTGILLRFPIRWAGSRLLADAGLRDAYRTAFPDEVRHPGNTWTPPYPENTPGRRPYGDQVLDRIDMIYFAGPGLRVRSVAVIGGSQDAAEITYDGHWPSDHRAVLAVFDIVR
jgi:endonuclease/exonuclease/phosphatase family metal-dependent hydrolase